MKPTSDDEVKPSDQSAGGALLWLTARSRRNYASVSIPPPLARVLASTRSQLPSSSLLFGRASRLGLPSSAPPLLLFLLVRASTSHSCLRACPHRPHQRVKCTPSPLLTTPTDSDQGRSEWLKISHELDFYWEPKCKSALVGKRLIDELFRFNLYCQR